MQWTCEVIKLYRSEAVLYWTLTGTLITTVLIKNCATERVQCASQTVLQNRYSTHHKLCYRTGTVRIKICATEQVQSASQTVLQNKYSLHYKLCYRSGTVHIT
jgi:hypothetical protein